MIISNSAFIACQSSLSLFFIFSKISAGLAEIHSEIPYAKKNAVALMPVALLILLDESFVCPPALIPQQGLGEEGKGEMGEMRERGERGNRRGAASLNIYYFVWPRTYLLSLSYCLHLIDMICLIPGQKTHEQEKVRARPKKKKR